MPDDLSDLEPEFRVNLCVGSHRDTCNCANPVDVPLCECGHARYRHWVYYGGMSGCGKTSACACETYRPAPPKQLPLPAPDPTPLPMARVVKQTWRARFRRFFTKES